MQIKSGFILREIAGNYIVVSVGESGGMISLSETGAMLFRLLEKGATEEELVLAILNEYEIDEQTAKIDVEAFIKKLEEAKLLK
jgi:hypothetical protein